MRMARSSRATTNSTRVKPLSARSVGRRFGPWRRRWNARMGGYCPGPGVGVRRRGMSAVVARRVQAAHMAVWIGATHSPPEPISEYSPPEWASRGPAEASARQIRAGFRSGPAPDRGAGARPLAQSEAQEGQTVGGLGDHLGHRLARTVAGGCLHPQQDGGVARLGLLQGGGELEEWPGTTRSSWSPVRINMVGG